MGTSSDVIPSIRLRHLFSVGLKMPNLNRDTLAMVYTPGVGDVCTHIQHHPEAVNTHTNRLNMVAVIGTGKSLGLKALSTLPLLEWICIQLKYYANLDAFPVVVSPGASLAEVVADLAGAMAGIVSIDEMEPADCPDVVFASQWNISRVLGEHFLGAEFTALCVKERLVAKKFGVV
jgi:malic enzyme